MSGVPRSWVSVDEDGTEWEITLQPPRRTLVQRIRALFARFAPQRYRRPHQ